MGSNLQGRGNGFFFSPWTAYVFNISNTRHLNNWSVVDGANNFNCALKEMTSRVD